MRLVGKRTSGLVTHDRTLPVSLVVVNCVKSTSLIVLNFGSFFCCHHDCSIESNDHCNLDLSLDK